jgi:hypothetical protein
MTEPVRQVQVTFSTTLAEQVACARATMQRQVSYWLMAFMFVVIPWATLLFVLWQGLPAGVGSILGLLVLGPVFLYFFPLYIVWFLRRGIAQPDGPYVLLISDTSIRIEGPAATADWKWSAVQRLAETADFFLIYIGRSQANAIPKRLLTADDCAYVRGLAASSTRTKTRSVGGA